MVGKQGKAAVHCPDGLQVNAENCLGAVCSKCISVCPKRCIEVSDTVKINLDICVACGHCASVCRATKANAIAMPWSGENMAQRIVENSLGVMESVGSERFFFINLAIDISDHCDCICVGAPLMMHDVGIFGSRDPVAVDHATLQEMKKQPLNPESSERGAFEALVKRSEVLFNHAAKMGIGSSDYELVNLSKKRR